MLFESDPADVRRVGMPQSKPLLDTHPAPVIRPEIDPPRIRRMGEFVRRGNRGRRQRRRHLRRRRPGNLSAQATFQPSNPSAQQPFSPATFQPSNLSAQQPFSQTNLLLTFIFTDRSFYL